MAEPTLKKKSLLPIVANAIMFQFGWFGCILGGEIIALLITPPLLMVHARWIMQDRSEWRYIVLLSTLGISMDMALGMAGILQWSSPLHGLPIPLWLCCVWVLFSTTLKHSLSWLSKHWAAPVTLGAIGGTASYWSGSILSEVALREPLTLSLLVIGLCWSMALPLFSWLAQRV